MRRHLDGQQTKEGDVTIAYSSCRERHTQKILSRSYREGVICRFSSYALLCNKHIGHVQRPKVRSFMNFFD